MKKLSIVVATYNRAPYLLRTLESLARQTLSPGLFEILVVNNNSSDNTPEVVAGFAGSHPQLQVRMVTETSQGLSYARNCGIASSGSTSYSSTTTKRQILSLLKAIFVFLKTIRVWMLPGGRLFRFTKRRCRRGTPTISRK